MTEVPRSATPQGQKPSDHPPEAGNTVTALAGSVATAIAVIARAILLGDEQVSKIFDALPKNALAQARSDLINGKGIGEPLIPPIPDRRS